MTRSTMAASAAFIAAAASFAGAAPGHAQPAEAAAFVAMDEIVIPIVDAAHIDGILHVSIVLQTRDSNGASAVYRRMPELRAASLGAAMEFARLHASPFTPVDVRKLSDTLTPALLGIEPGIAKVLIVRVSAMEG